MTKNFEALPEQINRQASEWFALMSSDDARAEDRLKFNAWLSERQEHRQAYQQIDSVWQILGDSSAADIIALRELGRSHSVLARLRWIFFSAMLNLRNTLSLFGARPYSYGLATTFLLIALGMVLIQQPNTTDASFYATKTAQIQTLKLEDGSEITLGAKSKIKISMNKSKRRAELIHGEAFFDIASDSSRPFVVLADKVAIEVVGTQFNVLKRPRGVNVSVLEGRVNVSNNDTQGFRKRSDNLLSLTAGQQVVKVDSLSIDQIENVNITELASWRNGRLIFAETPLKDVIADASRYFDGKFSMQSEELANQMVTMSLRTDQISQLPHMLAQVLPIQFREIPGNIIVFENSAIN